MVVTAAHCFCSLIWDEVNPTDSSNMYTGKECDKGECIRIPKPGHFLVRVGNIDKNSLLNLQQPQKVNYVFPNLSSLNLFRRLAETTFIFYPKRETKPTGKQNRETRNTLTC